MPEACLRHDDRSDAGPKPLLARYLTFMAPGTTHLNTMSLAEVEGLLAVARLRRRAGQAASHRMDSAGNVGDGVPFRVQWRCTDSSRRSLPPMIHCWADLTAHNLVGTVSSSALPRDGWTR